jgi:hypothetical protein
MICPAAGHIGFDPCDRFGEVMPASRQMCHRCRPIFLLVLQFILLIILLSLEVYEGIFYLEYISEKLMYK